MPLSPNNSAGIPGQQASSDGASPFNAHAFLIKQMMARMATAMLVEVMGVSNEGGVSPVGTVDIMPLVNQVDGAGNSVAHATIFGCPYSRLQGGANAVILDPQVGDIGIAVFASRDLSSVIATKGQANPGSSRRYDWADGLYIGGALNGTPTQYVQFSDDGIAIVSPGSITLSAPDVDLECETLTINATAAVNISTPTLTVNGKFVAGGELDVKGIATFESALIQGGKQVGATHTHGLPNGGQTLDVT